MADEHERRIRQPDAAARAFEQRYARLALEDGELLGDGGRGEAQRVGDGGDGPALVQLVQQSQTPKLEDEATLPNARHELARC